MLFTETMPIGERFLNSIAITILGMLVVFAVLIIIAYSLELLRIMFKDKNTIEKSVPEKKEPVKLVPVTQENVEDIDLILLITAAIAADEGSSTDDFFVRSIKPLAQKDTIWASAGRQQNMSKKM
ncbi:OadG family protein [Sedimentibacter hydroxybenzoicus DSM 7310]|uniref:OadG family protein n=1 Tax=Sedimentibacter hydroxybenzoicus DSM 7310 TaxID=1123245 RepID=A0A974BGL6_SEDHY|nr:OadG family protein [Sedimentibacter hydroxybenzoicus]NYB72556.1 OadG family protein [Sedimentibacter hydroxybenzoicus DSM 7310]